VIGLKIFIDSGKLDEIRKVKDYGLLDGVTTNPSLIKEAIEEIKSRGGSLNIREYIREILTVSKGVPVSLEVIGTTYNDMVEEGTRLFEMFNPLAKNVYIKIPVNPSMEEKSGKDFEGIKAIKSLFDKGIPINSTLIFTPEQALLAAKAGAAFVSPFVGRVDDYIRSVNKIDFKKEDYFPFSGLEKNDELLEDNGIVSGVDLVSQIREIFDNYGITQVKILAASIRNARQVREVALAGADIATLPFNVIKGLLSHYKTREGMERFTRDIVPEYKALLKD
jgi:transaldolase